VSYNNEQKRVANIQAGTDRIPRFCMCIPFIKNSNVIAALYVESYYTREVVSEKDKESNVSVEVEESSILVALRVEADEEMLKELEELQEILTDTETSVEEKNNAFEKMKDINITRGEEETLEKKILDNFKLKAFVKINGDQIRVVVASDKHDTSLANQIMRSIQENYTNKMYISVKFQK